MATKNWTRVDNVFCTANLEESIVICDTDPRLRGPGTDHVSILTTLSLEVRRQVSEPFRNFRMVDCRGVWGGFRDDLAERLDSSPVAGELLTDADFREAAVGLTSVIQESIEACVPLSKPVPHSRRWWNWELLLLTKTKNKLCHKSYKFRAIPEHLSHQSYADIRARYGEAIMKAKEQHWADYLEESEEASLEPGG